LSVEKTVVFSGSTKDAARLRTTMGTTTARMLKQVNFIIILVESQRPTIPEHKRKGESFSDVVKRLAPAPIETFGDFESYLNDLYFQTWIRFDE
jgi:hypothetical protein